MRFIDLEKIKPAIRDKIEALDEAKAAVLAESDPDRRAALIDRYRPRWTALREAFAAYSHDKCWYVECKNLGTDDDIDHYRPKSGVKEEPGHPGYYWLAFEWTNLRLSCHRANRPRTNPETGETGGKAEHFPLTDSWARAWGPDDDLSLEVPALLDPTKPPDVALLSFKPNGEVDLSPQFKGEPLLEAKFEASRLLLHLNWPKFRDARVMLYNQIERIVDRGDREAPQNYSGLHTAGEAFIDACRDLCTTMAEREEYSAAARVYVESFKHVWVGTRHCPESPRMTKTTQANGAAAALVRKLWQYCNVLRDDGLSYPDYVEQLTYLLFLKMSDEQEGGPVPPEYGWRSLEGLNADAVGEQYARILAALSERTGMLGLIFRNAKNKIRDPAKLRLLIVDLIGQTEWTGLSTDLKGDAYEGLLDKNARDTKSGAGQYFTPRPLIEAIVECVNPRLGDVVCDPACGTAGFLLAAYDHLKRSNPKMTRKEQLRLATRSIRGVELVEEVARLATMNLLLHGVGGNAEDELPIACHDSLKERPKSQVDVVLTNPPFGIRGSVTYAQDRRPSRNDDTLTVIRPDFWVQTANKQLNFLQHIVALLKPGARAAVVIPDNVLFETGAAAVIRRRLLETCRVHTLLRLPTGLFYAQGVKANVLFFNRPLAARQKSVSDLIWAYDLRSDKRFSLKTKPLQREDLEEFVALFRSHFRSDAAMPPTGDRRVGERFRCFDAAQILATTECRLDVTWEDESLQVRMPGLARLDEISRLVAEDLERALALLGKRSS